jgi:hypothetical protein
MLKTAFAAALLIGAASASHAQTFKFSGADKKDSLTLTSGGSGVYTGTFTTKGGSFDALAFSSSYVAKDTLVASSIDLSKGSDYDVVFVLEGAAGKKKSGSYIEYSEQTTTKAFKKIGSGKWKD